MKAKSIKELISNYFGSSNYTEINEIIDMNKSWKKMVGKTISKNTEIVKIKNGKITIKTSNPIWRNELAFQKKDLLIRFKKKEPTLHINEIEFR